MIHLGWKCASDIIESLISFVYQCVDICFLFYISVALMTIFNHQLLLCLNCTLVHTSSKYLAGMQ
jgi:hypothetical protein